MSEEIIKVFDYLGEKFGIAINWSSQNVIPTVEELCEKYIAYEISTSVVWLIICGILLIVAIVGIIYGIKEYEEFITATCVVVAIIVLSVIAIQIIDIVKCNIFPELQLLQFARSLMNNFK